MKNLKVPNKIGAALSKVGFQLKKSSPEILVIGGAIGVVVAAVGACIATTKAEDILAEHREKVEKIHEVAGDPAYEEAYTEKDMQKDLVITFSQTGWKFVKLYGVWIVLGGTSLACMLASNNILRRRNAALAAAYTAVDTSFKKYRERVVERFGEKVDKELKTGVKAMEIEEKVTDEKGKEKTVKKTVDVLDTPPGYSEYARIFDELNPNYNGSAEINRIFLQNVERSCNDMLRARGHLYLNEVYDMLGFERTKAGQIVGWVYRPKDPIGDNYVDFGIFDVRRPKAREFVNGYEAAIILDFNVDGNILEQMQ